MPSKKVVLIGGIATGKTSLIMRHRTGQFSLNGASPTLNVDSYRLPIESKVDLSSISIFDTSGEESRVSLTSLYYRNSVAALLLIANDDPESIPRARVFYDALMNDAPECRVILVRNKMDLPCRLDQEQLECLEAYVHSHAWPTCCVNGEGVNEVFNELLGTVREQFDAEAEGEDLVGSLEVPDAVDISARSPNEKKKCAC